MILRLEGLEVDCVIGERRGRIAGPVPELRRSAPRLLQLPHVVRTQDICAGNGWRVCREPSDAFVLRSRPQGRLPRHVRVDAFALRGNEVAGRDGRQGDTRHRHNARTLRTRFASSTSLCGT